MSLQKRSHELLLEIDQSKSSEEGVDESKLSEQSSIQVKIKGLQQRNPILKTVTLCRLWIFGFPQNEAPFDRAALLATAHPSLLLLLKQYQSFALEYSNISEEAWSALFERAQQMQEICLGELEKKSIKLTPQKLYFEIFGGESLWNEAIAKGYPKALASNTLLGCPYKYVERDISNPFILPASTRLEEPRFDTDDHKGYVNFFRIMNGLPPKNFL